MHKYLLKGLFQSERNEEIMQIMENKEVAFKNCVPFPDFTDCIYEIENTEIDNSENSDVVMPMYNLIEYSNNYSKTSENLWQYYKDELALNDAGATADFCASDNSVLFKFKQKITGKTAVNGRKDFEIVLSLKYLSNFENSWIVLNWLWNQSSFNLVWKMCVF